MLVIHRIELAKLNQPHEMREFKRDRPALFKRRLQALGKIVDVGHMRVNIVADDEIGFL